MLALETSESLLRVHAPDGACADLQLVQPVPAARDVLLWLPALGVAARNYLPLARELAGRGVAVALHEWRGNGSSDRRAARAQDWGYRELLEYDIAASRLALRTALPRARLWLGGHSLGGQLATLAAALAPESVAGLVLVASGSPYWRWFRHAWLILPIYLAVPRIASVCGYFPGRRLGFGGREARGVMADWARSGRSGRYVARGVRQDLEAALARVGMPVLALRLEDDWLGPKASLDWLLGKMPAAPQEALVVGAQDLDGAPADHFGWMKKPSMIAQTVATKITEFQ
ncbi:alpha/beta fold hydrolase [Dokdonella sp.]|uniref:alpha/beta hydrolase family protein n=1 Tax=Dokdonella sp. TaxID=2291710 RepID=UPI0037837211